MFHEFFQNDFLFFLRASRMPREKGHRTFLVANNSLCLRYTYILYIYPFGYGWGIDRVRAMAKLGRALLKTLPRISSHNTPLESSFPQLSPLVRCRLLFSFSSESKIPNTPTCSTKHFPTRLCIRSEYIPVAPLHTILDTRVFQWKPTSLPLVPICRAKLQPSRAQIIHFYASLTLFPLLFPLNLLRTAPARIWFGLYSITWR